MWWWSWWRRRRRRRRRRRKEIRSKALTAWDTWGGEGRGQKGNNGIMHAEGGKGGRKQVSWVSEKDESRREKGRERLKFSLRRSSFSLGHTILFFPSLRFCVLGKTVYDSAHSTVYTHTHPNSHRLIEGMSLYVAFVFIAFRLRSMQR